MAVFNKVYKKVANNGNDSDYALVGQVGVDGVPLDIYSPASDQTKSNPGLVPDIDSQLVSIDNNVNPYFLGSRGWELIRSNSEYNSTNKTYDMFFTGTYINSNNEVSSYKYKTTSIPSSLVNPLNIVNPSNKIKIANLHSGYGINSVNGRRVAHGYGNASVSCTRNTSTYNIASFTTLDLLNDGCYGYNFVSKNSNNQIKLLLEGLYFVELRYIVKSAESWGRIDICPYINGNVQRFLATQGSNGISTSAVACFHSFFIDVAANSTLDFRVTGIDDEVTTTVTVADVMVTLVDSKKFVTLTETDIANKDSIS